MLAVLGLGSIVMSKRLRLTEQWMQKGLWLVALLFASFLIGLGNSVVANLWDVEPEITVEQFIPRGEQSALDIAREQADKNSTVARERLQQAVLAHEAARANSEQASDAFNRWLATRQATARPDQDRELITRGSALDAIRGSERAALKVVEAQQKAQLDAAQQIEQLERRAAALREPAIKAAQRAATVRELKVFAYRLALTLPLLLIAAWLFVKKRKGTYWPFVWGFIFFAGFAFFVELVPYLPSYGGYVRNIVGVVLTFVIGRYAIRALQRYLERQKIEESLPDDKRRQTLRYEAVFTRLSKSVCPGCERAIDLKDPTVDFCPHCGIGLFDRCVQCKTRKGSFARFCFACGTPGKSSLPE